MATSKFLLVINKPYGIPVQGGNNVNFNIDLILPILCKNNSSIRLVHRIDKNTSGILLLAKTKEVAQNITMLFKENKIKKSLTFLKNKAKTLEDIYNNCRYIMADEVNFNQDDIKLIDDKAKKVISDFTNKFANVDELSKETLEPIVNELIKSNDTNFKGVGQPLRIALTGSKFGPGIYDIIISLGKEEVTKRLANKKLV